MKYLDSSVCDVSKYLKGPRELLAKTSSDGEDVKVAYSRVMLQRYIAVREALGDYRVNRRRAIKEKIKQGQLDFTKSKEQQRFRREKPKITRAVHSQWQSRVVAAMERMAEAGNDFEPDRRHAVGCELFVASFVESMKDRETALDVWSRKVGKIDGKCPLQWAIEIVDKVWPLDCECEGLRGTSIRAAVKDGKISYYVGYTHACHESFRDAERFGFLTQKSRGIPPLVRPDGENFDLDEVKTVLGFQSVTVWNNEGYPMLGGTFARCIEGHMQRLLWGARLGIRCNRALDAGARYMDKWRVHEVFFTSSPRVPSMLGKSVKVRKYSST